MIEKNDAMWFTSQDLTQMRYLHDLAKSALPLQNVTWSITPDVSPSDYLWKISLDLPQVENFCVYQIKTVREDNKTTIVSRTIRYLGVDKTSKELPFGSMLALLSEDYKKWVQLIST